MDITWLGHSCFRLRGRDAVIITDPCPPDTGYSIGRLNADIVTLSHEHPEHNYMKALSGSPSVIKGPGEYEIGGVFVSGIATYHDQQNGSERGKNNAYIMSIDGLTVCHLGDLGHTPTSDQAEEMSDADILLVPVGGNTTINAAQAAEIVSLLQPKVVVPMHYLTPAAKVKLDPLEPFLKEMGQEAIEPVARLSVNTSSLPQEMTIVVLDYRG
jgi:L-ascorbate metabolism protein UlaG (beta-lactamase superfamily)